METLDLRAIRPFMYNGTNYSPGQLFKAPVEDAYRLIGKGCAERVSIAPGTPVTEIKAETKELKVKRSKKS